MLKPGNIYATICMAKPIRHTSRVARAARPVPTPVRAAGLARYRAIRAAFQRKLNFKVRAPFVPPYSLHESLHGSLLKVSRAVRSFTFKNAKLLRLLDAQLDNPRCEATDAYL